MITMRMPPLIKRFDDRSIIQALLKRAPDNHMSENGVTFYEFRLAGNVRTSPGREEADVAVRSTPPDYVIDTYKQFAQRMRSAGLGSMAVKGADSPEGNISLVLSEEDMKLLKRTTFTATGMRVKPAAESAAGPAHRR